MFDPEKVERIKFRENWRDPFVGEYIEASDYDQLLALYREFKARDAQTYHVRLGVVGESDIEVS